MKHVEMVESRNNFLPFQHASPYMTFGGMVGKV